MAEKDENNSEMTESQNIFWDKYEKILEEFNGLTLYEAKRMLKEVERHLDDFVLHKP